MIEFFRWLRLLWQFRPRTSGIELVPVLVRDETGTEVARYIGLPPSMNDYLSPRPADPNMAYRVTGRQIMVYGDRQEWVALVEVKTLPPGTSLFIYSKGDPAMLGQRGPAK